MPDSMSTPVLTSLKIEFSSSNYMYSGLLVVRRHFDESPFECIEMSTPKCSERPTVSIFWPECSISCITTRRPVFKCRSLKCIPPAFAVSLELLPEYWQILPRAESTASTISSSKKVCVDIASISEDLPLKFQRKTSARLSPVKSLSSEQINPPVSECCTLTT